MEIVMCPTCGKFKTVTSGIKRTRCNHCNRSMGLKDLKVFFRSENMEEITAAMGELNVAHSRGGMFEEDYRRETELFGELKNEAEAERERLRRSRSRAETLKRSHVPVTKVLEYALDHLVKMERTPFTLSEFIVAINRKRQMGEEECLKLLEVYVQSGRLYMPDHDHYDVV